MQTKNKTTWAWALSKCTARRWWKTLQARRLEACNLQHNQEFRCNIPAWKITSMKRRCSPLAFHCPLSWRDSKRAIWCLRRNFSGFWYAIQSFALTGGSNWMSISNITEFISGPGDGCVLAGLDMIFQRCITTKKEQKSSYKRTESIVLHITNGPCTKGSWRAEKNHKTPREL